MSKPDRPALQLHAPGTSRLMSQAPSPRSSHHASPEFSRQVEEGQHEERAGHRASARAIYEQALQAVANTEDGRQASSVLRWIARTWNADGDADAALGCLDAALAIAEAWEDDAAAGHAMNVQAVVRWQHGDMDDAERLYLLARHRAVRAGDAKLAAMTAQNLGVLANIRGDFDVAEQQYRASLADYRSLGLTNDVCVALNNLGLLYIAQQRWDEAEVALLEGLRLCEQNGDAVARLQLDINLAELWVARGDYTRAHGAVRKALTAAAQIGDGSAIGKAMKLLGIIANNTGSYDEAERHLLHAEEVATARGEVLLQAEIARERATLARRTGRNRDVLQQLNRSHRLFTQLRAQPELRDIGARVDQLEQEFVHVARRWGESIEAKDRYTQGHCQRVADLACAIAEAGQFDATALFWFRIGALLHDVGKLVIPEAVLNKPGKLDDDEWALMKSHTTAGAEMLADIEFPWDIRPMVESHHERWDGKGYPHGLQGESIPLVARILAIADVYDALTSVRSYKRALTHEATMEILRKDVGTVFDPAVFAWFETFAAEWPTRIAGTTPVADPLDERAVDDATGGVTFGELDDLTGVPMRKAFRETSDRVLEARRTTGRPVAMLVIDVDYFKLVNDAHGHLGGDTILRRVAELIRQSVRPTDYVARYAGDEFVVLLPGTRLEDACAVAERVRVAVAGDSVSIRDGVMCQVTLSIGVACAPQHGETLEALFGAADAALFGAKRVGRNAVLPATRVGSQGQDIALRRIVGRTPELDRLRQWIANAVEGKPQLVVISGEAGVGKSTLLKQLGPEIGVRSGAILMGQCLEASQRMPYAPWADVLLCAQRAGLLSSRQWRELHRLVPELANERSTGPDGTARALFEELDEALRLISAARPVMITIDDMQWADAHSWDVLEFLLSRLTDQRILICLTIRPEDLSPDAESRLRRLSRVEISSAMRLERLRTEELAVWLRSALGEQEPPPGLLAHVVARSEGNAFFAVQTLRALVEDGRLQWQRDGWQFSAIGPTPLPQAIGDLLARRVAGLTTTHREILTLAAVLGREFDPAMLVASYEGSEADVHDALDSGLATSVLVATAHVRSTLAFAHVSLRDLLVDGINPLRRKRLHERVGRVMEARDGHDAAALAFHFDQAGLSGDAFLAGMRAGRQAQALYAYREAAEQFRIAQRHAPGSSAAVDVEWSLAIVEELAGRTLQAEAHCERLLGEFRVAAFERGIIRPVGRMRERLRLHRGAPIDEIIEACGPLRLAAEEANDSLEIASLLVMLSTAHQRRGDIPQAQLLASEAIEHAERVRDPALSADAVMRLGSVLLASSPASAVPHYRRALDMFTRAGDRSGQLRCHINIGTACDRAGNHPGAEVSYRTALEIARDMQIVDLEGVASLNLGVLLMKTGRLDAARARFDEALAQFERIGHDPFRLAAMYNLAHLARAESDPATALELYSASALLAASLSHVEVRIGAMAGAGLAELDLLSTRGAVEHRDQARALLAGRQDWFQGRELLDALELRVCGAEESGVAARRRLLERLPQVEVHDPYAAVWLGAECVELMDGSTPALSGMRSRLLVQARALGYSPLVGRLASVPDGDTAVVGSIRAA